MSPANSSSDSSTAALLGHGDVARILAALNTNGQEARIVGGALRDVLMKRPVGDIDIATTALPDIVLGVARKNGWKAIPTGLEHGTVTLTLNGTPYEVTTLRRDVETDGRRAVVAFTRDFHEDAFRRDFTINALSLSIDGKVHDYASGLTDAVAGIVRFMGDAERRISEDYLRILRFFRFFASHGKGLPDAEGLAACEKLRAGMAQLSRERVRQELLKLLVAPRAADAVRAMEKIQLWPLILPEGQADIACLLSLIELEENLGRLPEALLRLAALAGEQETLQTALKLSNKEADRVAIARRSSQEMVPLSIPDHAARSLIFRIGSEGYSDAVLLGGARANHPAQLIRERLAAAKPYGESPLINPFSSSDLADYGVAPGPRMGSILKTALALWLERGLPETSDDQRGILAEAIARHPV